MELWYVDKSLINSQLIDPKTYKVIDLAGGLNS